MTKVRLLKGKLENKRVQESISKKGLGVAIAGLLMATGFLLSENPKEVHAEAFNRIVNGGAFTVSGVPKVSTEVGIGGSSVVSAEVGVGDVVDSSVSVGVLEEESKEPSKEEVVVQEQSSEEIATDIIDTLSLKYTYNPKLKYSGYRKSVEFDLTKNGGHEPKVIETLNKLLNYFGSKEFSVNVTKLESNKILVDVGFKPNLDDKDGDGYADKLNLYSMNEKELEIVAQRYFNYLYLQGYNVQKYKADDVYLGHFTFKMNYNNGRIQKEYDYIMDFLNKEENKGKKISIKVLNIGNSQVRVQVFEVK